MFAAGFTPTPELAAAVRGHAQARQGRPGRLAQSDVFIGLCWQRYGQIGPGMQVSGLEEEFELSAGLPRLLYVKAPAPSVRSPRW
jgi:hypothetical protein